MMSGEREGKFRPSYNLDFSLPYASSQHLCRLDEFMEGFNTISLKLKEMYQVFSSFFDLFFI